MRHWSWALCLALVLGCAPAQDRPSEDESAPPAAISLADVAGTWTLHAVSVEGDSTLVMADMVATPTTEGWTMTFPGRDPVPMRVVLVDGDSIVTETGPYQSALREGVDVTTRSVVRLEEGMLLGAFEARYATTGPDSVLRGRIEASRKQ